MLIRNLCIEQTFSLPLVLCGVLMIVGCDSTSAPVISQPQHEFPVGVADLAVEAARVPEAPAQVETVDEDGQLVPTITDQEGIVRIAAGPEAAAGQIQSAAVSQPTADLSTPEALMMEISRLRNAPLDIIQQPQLGAPGGYVEIQLTPEQTESERMRRLYEMLDLSVQVIGKTFRDPQQSQTFGNAVVYLSETRMQLTLLGDEKQIDLLQEDAETLYKQDATSFAAVEASFKLLQLTQILAQQRQEDVRWSLAFARQARLFAERFPLESSRAAVGLASAGRHCDSIGELEESRMCYEILKQRFPETPFAQQSEAVLRRLALVGQPLVEFGGPTHDGGNINLQHYSGKPLLVVFWSSESAQFQRDLPFLEDLQRQAKVTGLNIVGVNLDTDEKSLDAFLESHSFAAQHIFYPDPKLRGTQNLVVSHYGVSQVPTYWIVGADGIVRSIHAEATQLASLLATE